MPAGVLVVAGPSALGRRVVEELTHRGGLDLHVFAPDRSHSASIEATLARMDAAVICADDPTTTTACYVSLCREAGVASVVGRLTERGASVALDLARNRSAWKLGCPECARLHEVARGPLGAVSPSTRKADPVDIETTAKLVALAGCKAIEVARGLRPADALATSLDFDARSVTVEPVARHHACTVCAPGVRAMQEALRTEVLDWRDRCLGGVTATPVEAAQLLPRLRMMTGKRFGLFDVPGRRPPAVRQAVWRFFRTRGVDPKDNPLANAHSVLAVRKAIRDGMPSNELSEGFDFEDADTAEAISLVEGLERLFALSFCEPRRIVNARYSDVAREALDPRSFPLFAEAQYAAPDFPLRRFDPDATSDWIWGLDVTSGAPVLVAFDLVFASSRSDRIYRANSNGAACHSDVRQAIVNGICETVERDALMVAWLNEMSLPRVALEGRDPDPWSVRATFERLDFDLEHVDITTDLDIPVLLAVLRDRHNPDFFLVDMVASVDPSAQLRKLYRELAQFVFPYLVDRDHFRNACTHDDDPDRVREFPDHVAFYQDERRNRHAAFLTAHATTRRFGQGAYVAEAVEPRDELDLLVARLAASGHRVIAVDCTPPLLRDAGLHAVKVLIPGLQPLNCGHRFRPLGGERVLSVAQRMGRAARRRALHELNPWPHPFW